MPGITRAALVDAARDLNKVLSLTPMIDVKKGVKELRAEIVEASVLLPGNGTDAQPDVTNRLSKESRDLLEALSKGDGDEKIGTETAGTETSTVAKVGKKVAASKANKVEETKSASVSKPAKRTSSRDTGKDPKPKVEFHPLREGTIRGRIFAKMDGKHTSAQIAEELSLSPGNTHSHIFCLWRDCGIGFKYDDEKRVTAVLPAGISSAFRETAQAA
jgi:hypothetical protein